MSKREFQTEVNQLLQLIVHSLYSHPEIFLRELISNSSDALDKLRHLTLTDDAYKSLPFDPRIDLELDEEKKTLTIADTGIGMNEEELAANLGTIARSGTKNFLSQLSGDAKKDSNLIGQFGVGFYSAFMVADRVEVVSRKAGEDQAWRWISDGKTGFDIEPAERSVAGTTVLLHLNEEGQQYANSWRLKEIVKKYSNHIAFPIFLTYDKSEWNEAEKKSVKTSDHGTGQCRQCSLAPPQERAQRRGLQGALQIDHRRLGRSTVLVPHQGGRQSRLHHALLCAVEGAARSLPGGVQDGRKALCEARLHHGRCQGASAAVSALRARALSTAKIFR